MFLTSHNTLHAILGLFAVILLRSVLCLTLVAVMMQTDNLKFSARA